MNQLATVKMTLDDELQALLLLSSLPESWETLVVSLNNSAPNDVLSFNTVKCSMFNEKTRRKDAGSDNGQLLLHGIGAGVRADRVRGFTVDLERDLSLEVAPKVQGCAIIVVKNGIFESSACHSRKKRTKRIIR